MEVEGEPVDPALAHVGGVEGGAVAVVPDDQEQAGPVYVDQNRAHPELLPRQLLQHVALTERVLMLGVTITDTEESPTPRESPQPTSVGSRSTVSLWLLPKVNFDDSEDNSSLKEEDLKVSVEDGILLYSVNLRKEPLF